MKNLQRKYLKITIYMHYIWELFSMHSESTSTEAPGWIQIFIFVLPSRCWQQDTHLSGWQKSHSNSPKLPLFPGTMDRLATLLLAEVKADPTLISQCFQKNSPFQSTRLCPLSQWVLSGHFPLSPSCPTVSNLVAKLVFSSLKLSGILAMASSHLHFTTKHAQKGSTNLPKMDTF